MAEPDFDQIARFCLNLTPGGGLAGTHLTTDLLIEQLRQVWNARGAADATAIDVETHRVAAEANLTGRTDLEIDLVTAIQNLDR